jgi:hypothetical protein
MDMYQPRNVFPPYTVFYFLFFALLMMSDSKVKERVMHGWTKAGLGLTIVPNKAYITFLIYIYPFSTLRLVAIFNLMFSDVSIMLNRYLIQNKRKVFFF